MRVTELVVTGAVVVVVVVVVVDVEVVVVDDGGVLVVHPDRRTLVAGPVPSLTSTVQSAGRA